MIGVAGERRGGTGWRGRDNAVIPLGATRRERRPLLIHSGDFLPEFFTALTTTVADMEGQHLACLGRQRDPEPRPGRSLPDDAPPLVGFRFSPAKGHCVAAGDGLDLEMIGRRLKALAHKGPEPSEAAPHRAADSAQRDSLEQEPSTQRTLLGGDGAIFWKSDEGPATGFTLGVLFSRVRVAIFLVLG